MNRRPAPIAEPIIPYVDHPHWPMNSASSGVNAHPPGGVDSTTSDYQRILRETAAARRAHRGEVTDPNRTNAAAASTNQIVAPPPSAQPATASTIIPRNGQQQLHQQQYVPNPFIPTQQHPSIYPSLPRSPPVPMASAPSVTPPPAARSPPTSTRNDLAKQQLESDAEFARRLQQEEEQAVANAAAQRQRDQQQQQQQQQLERERRQREEDDARLARQLFEQQQQIKAAEEADAQLARQLYAAEEAARRRQQEEAAAAVEIQRREALQRQREREREDAAAAAMEFQRREQQRVAMERDAALARALQMEEEGSDVPLSSSPPASQSKSPQGEILLPEDVAMEDADSSAESLDAIHRRHAEMNRQRQLQNSADILTNEPGRPAAAASSSSSRSNIDPNRAIRSREQIIQRLHNLQGTYPVDSRHSTSFRFTPSGRLIVHVEPEEEEAAIAHAATDGLEESPDSIQDTEAQRQALNAYAHQRQLEEQQRAANSGLLGMMGSMFERYQFGRQQGIPFPLSLLVDPNNIAASSHPSYVRVMNPRDAEVDIDRLGYEELLQLEEAMGSVKPKVQAATQEQINQLPVREYKKPIRNNKPSSSSNHPTAAAASSSSASSSATSSDSCSICLSEFEDGDVIKTLPCIHSFHAAEIDKWLLTNTKCPTCQHPCSANSN